MSVQSQGPTDLLIQKTCTSVELNDRWGALELNNESKFMDLNKLVLPQIH